MTDATLEEALYRELCDILDAENELLDLLPRFQSAAYSPELRQLFADHLVETKQQVLRLRGVFGDIGRPALRKPCRVMNCLIAEAEETMQSAVDPVVLDAFLIVTAQRIEHYEIATYGALCAWAEALGYWNALEKLTLNISEEEMTDEYLSEIAYAVNTRALGKEEHRGAASKDF